MDSPHPSKDVTQGSPCLRAYIHVASEGSYCIQVVEDTIRTGRTSISACLDWGLSEDCENNGSGDNCSVHYRAERASPGVLQWAGMQGRLCAWVAIGLRLASTER